MLPTFLTGSHRGATLLQALKALLLVSMGVGCSGNGVEGDVDSQDEPLSCEVDDDCSDGAPCNGLETCEDGVCTDGPPVECAEGERCEADTGECALDCDFDGDGSDSVTCGGDDCDDSDAQRYPGNVEYCTDADGNLDEDAATRDEDCDPQTLGSDLDADGFYDSRCANRGDSGMLAFGSDCDDSNDLKRPGFQEICDGLDNDCNGRLDYLGEDDDGDGYADCQDLVGSGIFDCDDTSSSINPGVAEDVCDGIDADCDGVAEDADQDGAVATDATCVGGDLPANDCDDADVRLACPAALLHASVDCSTGCERSCKAGYGDCDGSFANGCEANLGLSSLHCGECGNSCAFGCVEGACRQAVDVDLGVGQACALLDDGNVACWGGNASGALGRGLDGGTYTDPGLVSPALIGGDVDAIAMGALASCALFQGDRVACWGRDDSGQIGDGAADSDADPELAPVEISAGSVEQLSAGAGSTICALNAAHNLLCWGSNFNGQLGQGAVTPPTASSPTLLTDGTTSGHVMEVSVGGSHVCALLDDDHIACWGRNDEGQIGDGSTDGEDVTSPVRVSTGVIDKNVTAVFSGASHSCAILDGGQVACWGDDTYGQVGNGDDGQDAVYEPVLLSGFPDGTEIVSLALGNWHSCALSVTGQVYCWGNDGHYGQVGNGVVETSNILEPQLIEPAAFDGGVTALSAGNYATCAVLADGQVACWGGNEKGEIGTGQVGGFEATPTLVASILHNPVSISADNYHACVLSDDGRASCWGSDSNGQIGDGDTGASKAYSPSPVDTSSLPAPMLEISTGYRHTCALLSNGQVACWGSDNDGQLGDGVDSDEIETSPVLVDDTLIDGRAVGISLGMDHSCALLNDGSITCWGSDRNGQLGNGAKSTARTDVPVFVETGVIDGNAVDIASGSYHSCALLNDGNLACWGSDSQGESGNGGSSSDTWWPAPVAVATDVIDGRAVDIACGSHNSCSTLENGDLACWGDDTADDYGKIGNGLPLTDEEAPIIVGGATAGVTMAVDVAEEHACALREDGSIVCWGDDDAGQLGDGVDDGAPKYTPVVALTSELLPRAVALDVGWEYTCALGSDGTVACWGSDTSGKLGDGDDDEADEPSPVRVTMSW